MLRCRGSLMKRGFQEKKLSDDIMKIWMSI